MKFSNEELTPPVPVVTPFAPDSAVCPSDALRVGEDGTPVVDSERCVGCGLCVVRCPVGAIHLNPDSGEALIKPASEDSYGATAYVEPAFTEERSFISEALVRETAPFDDADRAEIQLQRFEGIVVRADPQRVARLLTRNAFLSLGRPARLKNAGDNNAFTELAVGEGSNLILAEIEPGGDVLDALRRVLSGVAIARNRYGVAADKVVPCVVLTRLPNERVDYYRVVSDARERIGVRVRSLPLAMLLLAIRSGGNLLLEAIESGAVVDESHRSLSQTVSSLWGALSDPEGLGLSPEK